MTQNNACPVHRYHAATCAMLSLLLLALSWTGAPPARAADRPAQWPIMILKPAEFEDRQLSGIYKKQLASQTLQEFYTRPVKLGDNLVQHLALTNPQNSQDKKEISTCRQYQDYRNQGWYKATTYDLTMESYFIYNCGLLDLLSHAAPSVASRFRAPPYSLDQPALYPAAFLDPITFARGTMCPDAGSLTACMQERGGQLRHENSTLYYEDDNYYATFGPLLKADLNGDFQEDLALYYAYYAKGGTLRAYGLTCLTWRPENERIDMVPCPASNKAQ